MEKVLVDTDVFIDFLRGHTARVKGFFNLVEDGKIEGLISLISLAELYSGQEMENVAKKEGVESLLSIFLVANLGGAIAEMAGEIRRKHKMALADALIASTAILNNVSLFTFNTGHFKSIKQLKLYSFE